MTKEQHLELLRHRLDQIAQKRVIMIRSIQGKPDNEVKLTELYFKLKYGGVEEDIETQIEWIENNL